MVVLHGKAYIAQATSLEKFRGIDQSMKTAKLFHLVRFAIYGIGTYVHILVNHITVTIRILCMYVRMNVTQLYCMHMQ